MNRVPGQQPITWASRGNGRTIAVSKPSGTTVTKQQLQFQVIRQVTAGHAKLLPSSPNCGAGVGVSDSSLLKEKNQI